MERIFEFIENSLEVVNFLIGIVILFVGVPFLQRLRLTFQKKAIRFFLIGIFLFATTEILAVANIVFHSNIIELLQEFAETGFIISIAIALFFLKQSDTHEVSSLRRSAFKDALTELHNPAFFRPAAQKKLIEAKLHHLQIGLILLDIDNFKAYNDKFGHEAGNVALRCVATELRKITRSGDLVARYGGEEFIVLVNSGLDESLILAKRICRGIASTCVPQYYDELHSQITVSVGCALFAGYMKTLEELIEAADAQLYRAKRTGKNRVCFTPHSQNRD